MGAPATQGRVRVSGSEKSWPISAIQLLLAIGTIYYLLKGFPLVDVQGLLTGTITRSAVLNSPGLHKVIYAVLALSLGAIVARVLGLKKFGRIRDLVTSFSCATLLYLVHPLFFASLPVPHRERWWIFPLVAPFFLVYLSSRSSQKVFAILELVAFCAGLQATFAVASYFLGINQFWNPGFGWRTMGTFENPNYLYPVCLLSLGLGAGLVRAVDDPAGRWLFAGLTSACLVAVILTFTRAAWLGLAAMVLYGPFAHLVFHPLKGAGNETSLRKVQRLFVCIAVGLLLLATALVRTGGRMIGNSEDRSFWGRVAIWQTAWGIFRDRPAVGHGFGTYGELQYRPRHMNPRLRSFGPMNNEAKNLVLNLACEFGLLGLAICGWIGVSYFRVYKLGYRRLAPESPERAVLIGMHASLVALMIAGLFDTPILTKGREAATWMACLYVGAICLLVGKATETN